MAKKPQADESKAALDAWAEHVVALEPDVAAGVAAYSKRLAANPKLAKGDREFAEAQAAALGRALRRRKAGASGAKETKNK